uniref:Uncharacterized protein n=1 Tax=Coccidioides posadasii RMSCC 3488 TaxID=454284 RepID=A0A0J6FCP8_COCPO|nr:hypothetical protein CPAG_04385 [Coccidioides posadasii RMSCC 3488]
MQRPEFRLSVMNGGHGIYDPLNAKRQLRRTTGDDEKAAHPEAGRRARAQRQTPHHCKPSPAFPAWRWPLYTLYSNTDLFPGATMYSVQRARNPRSLANGEEIHLVEKSTPYLTRLSSAQATTH